MAKLKILFITLSAAMVAETYAQYTPGGAQCGCFNLVQIDKPGSISECYPKLKFYNQVEENYDNLFAALTINSKPYGCDYTQYRRNVEGIKTRTLGILDAYYSCTTSDCTSAIQAAYARFIDFRNNIFNPYTVCSYVTFSAECAQVLLQARSPVFGSAENIMVGMLTCAKLRAQSRLGILKVSPAVSLTQLVLSKKVSECNCIKIDPRPIPADQTQCFSAEFIATVRNFVEVNFERVTSSLASKENSCDYTQIIGLIQQIKDLAIEGTKLLESTSSKVAQVSEIQAKFGALAVLYTPTTRNYILNNPKSCYFNVRAARISPVTIIDAVLAVLLKCIQYVDVANKRC